MLRALVRVRMVVMGRMSWEPLCSDLRFVVKGHWTTPGCTRTTCTMWHPLNSPANLVQYRCRDNGSPCGLLLVAR